MRLAVATTGRLECFKRYRAKANPSPRDAGVIIQNPEDAIVLQLMSTSPIRTTPESYKLVITYWNTVTSYINVPQHSSSKMLLTLNKEQAKHSRY